MAFLVGHLSQECVYVSAVLLSTHGQGFFKLRLQNYNLSSSLLAESLPLFSVCMLLGMDSFVLADCAFNVIQNLAIQKDGSYGFRRQVYRESSLPAEFYQVIEFDILLIHYPVKCSD